MTRVFSVPQSLLCRHLKALSLDARTKNALLRAGLQEIGDLQGWTEEEVLEIENLGEIGLAAVRRTLRQLGVRQVPASEFFPTDPRAGEAAEDGGGLATPTFGSELCAIPVQLHSVRMASLALTRAVAARTDGIPGLKTLGDLASLSTEILRDHLGPTRLSALAAFVNELSNLSAITLRSISWSDPSEDLDTIPNLSLDVLRAVAGARTYEEEVLGLVVDLSKRDAGFFLARLPFGRSEQPTLESLGDEAGITRERVRQIVRRTEKKLRQSGLRLPIASRHVELIDKHGGLMGTSTWLDALKDEGLPQAAEHLHALPALAELGLVPTIEYRPKGRVWLTETGLRRWVESGEWDSVINRLRRRAQRGYRRIGAVEASGLHTMSSLRADDLAAAVTPRDTSLSSCLGYLIVAPGRDSSLSRAVEKVLAVSRPMNLHDLRNGLRRWRRLGTLPPADVIGAILEAHSSFQVERGSVTWAAGHEKSREDVLADSELVGLEILESQGGVTLLWEFLDAMEEAGFSIPTGQLFLSRPYIRRPATALYTLRGGDIEPSLIRRMQKRRDDQRSTSVHQARWVSPDRFEVHYALSRYNLQGVVGVPSSFETPVEKWKARFADGRTKKLTLRNGFLWSLKDWFDREEADVGDHMFATFMPGRAIVELELVHA